MRIVMRAGLLGAAPGLLLIAISVGVEMWVETGGGLGFGLLGMLLLWIGVFLGMLSAASRVDHGGWLLLGVGVGFAGGLAAGLTVPSGVWWVLLVPVGMLLGGLAGTWLSDHLARRPASPHGRPGARSSP